jgi:hypothetical protein
MKCERVVRAKWVSAGSVERKQTLAHEYGDEHSRQGGAPPTDSRLWARQIRQNPVVVMAGGDDARASGKRRVAADADWSTFGLFRYDEDAVRLGSEPRADRSWWKTVLANGEELAARPVVVDISLDAGVVRKVDPEGTNFAERYGPRGFDVTKVAFFGPDIGDVATFTNIGATLTAASTLLVLNEGAIVTGSPIGCTRFLRIPPFGRPSRKARAWCGCPNCIWTKGE